MITKKQAEQIMKQKLNYKDIQMFVHCKKCVDTLPKGQSMQEYCSFEFGSVPFVYPNSTAKVGILALFCKRHQEPVWDSRHLTHLF